MRMVLVGSPCKARRRHLLSPSVTEHRYSSTVILKNELVHAVSMCNFHSYTNQFERGKGKMSKHKEITFETEIVKARQAIELMKERRTALISAAVTGKIDMRGTK